MVSRMPSQLEDVVADSSVQAGSALAVAVVVAAMLLVLGGAVATRAVGSGQAALGHEQRTVARLAAEQALEDAIRALGGPTHRDVIDRRQAAPLPPLPVGLDTAASGVGDLRLDVDVRPGETPDVRVVTVTAGVGAASHVATAHVRPFLAADHVLMLEHRTVDPALLHMPRLGCTFPGGDPRRSASCRDAVLEVGALDGPVHLNEGGVLGPRTGSGPLLTTSRAPDGADAAGAGVTEGVATLRPELRLPRTIGEVVGGATVTCRFRGPTSLRFDGTLVRVRSPRSALQSSPSQGTRPIGCLGVDPTALVDFVAIDLPSDAVIEVVGDEEEDCTAHPLGIDPGEDADRAWTCTSGDAFVWGRYAGRRTVLAEDDIQIVWDLEPGDATAPALLARGDLLGLVAGDSIVLRRLVGRPIRRVAPLGQNLPIAGPGLPPFGAHPLDAPSDGPLTWEQPRIVASLVALRGSVTLQNPFLGQPHVGPLEIVGSVAGRFPGVLAWEERTSRGTLVGTTGYPVSLRYDRRLVLDAPPLLPMTDGGTLRILHRDVG